MPFFFILERSPPRPRSASGCRLLDPQPPRRRGLLLLAGTAEVCKMRTPPLTAYKRNAYRHMPTVKDGGTIKFFSVGTCQHSISFVRRQGQVLPDGCLPLVLLPKRQSGGFRTSAGFLSFPCRYSCLY